MAFMGPNVGESRCSPVELSAALVFPKPMLTAAVALFILATGAASASALAEEVAQPSTLAVSVDARYGRSGAIRPKIFTAPETIYLLIDVTHLQATTDGSVDFTSQIEILSEDGQRTIDVVEKRHQQVLHTSASQCMFSADVRIPPGFPAGEYNVAVKVKDQLANQTATAKMPVTINDKAVFDATSIRLTYDKSGDYHAGTSAPVTKEIYLQCTLTGYSLENSCLRFRVVVDVQDEGGNLVTLAPFDIQRMEPFLVSDAPGDHQTDIQTRIAILRPGRYLIRLNAYDRIGEATAIHEIPIQLISGQDLPTGVVSPATPNGESP